MFESTTFQSLVVEPWKENGVPNQQNLPYSELYIYFKCIDILGWQIILYSFEILFSK